MIKYENGTKDVFNDATPQPTQSQPAPAQVQQTAPIQKQVTPPKTLVPRKGDIWYNGVVISESAVKGYMSCAPGAFELYKKGNNQFFWGDELFLLSLIGDLGMLIQINKGVPVNPLLRVGSFASFVSGIGLMIGGSSNVKKSVQMYNIKAYNPTSFNFKINPTGIGLVMRF